MTSVVKVGGSLYDLPDLGARLQAALRESAPGRVLLVPGGGAMANVIRAWDQQHGLGEETAHWLALRALTLNAHLLARLLEGASLVGDPRCFGEMAILDAYAFAQADEGCPGSLPHTWEVTSDSLSARVAEVIVAERLVLLKSVSLPASPTWHDASRRGLVDPYFATIAARLTSVDIRVVNLRSLSAK